MRYKFIFNSFSAGAIIGLRIGKLLLLLLPLYWQLLTHIAVREKRARPRQTAGEFRQLVREPANVPGHRMQDKGTGAQSWDKVMYEFNALTSAQTVTATEIATGAREK